MASVHSSCPVSSAAKVDRYMPNLFSGRLFIQTMHEMCVFHMQGRRSSDTGLEVRRDTTMSGETQQTYTVYKIVILSHIFPLGDDCT